MKTLKMLVVKNEHTDMVAFSNVTKDMSDIEVTEMTDVESAIASMSNHKYELLIADKNLPTEDFIKLNKLSEILFPDKAMVNMNLDDEDFIAYKLNSLMVDWKEAQSESRRNYIDNPEGF